MHSNSALNMMRKMYSLMYILILGLLYHSQQAEGCVSCPYGMHVTKCNDPFNRSYRDACENGIDVTLCQKYGGGYSVYCQDGISTRSCSRRSTSCNKAGAEGACVTCSPLNLDYTQCNDPFNGTYSDACEKGMNTALCLKYGNGYNAYCLEGTCFKEASSCKNYLDEFNKAGSFHYTYPVTLILASLAARVIGYGN